MPFQSAITATPWNVVVYSPYPETHACAYIRIVAPMRAAGWNVIWARRYDQPGQPFDVDIAREADLIVIQRQFPSLRTEQVLLALLRLGTPIVYDLDDMLLDVPNSHPSSSELVRRAPFIKWALNEVDLVTVSTPNLKRLIEEQTGRPIRVQPNLVDWGLFDALPRRRDQEFRLLVSGTSTHRSDWAILEDPLDEFLTEYHKVARAVFFGDVPARFADHPLVKSIGFEDDYRRYASHLRTLEVHAALVPLEDIEFNRSKSDIKWLEYSAAGLPGAYSDVAPYRQAIEHLSSGLLVANTAAKWLDAMKVLMSNSQETALMLEKSRHNVFRERSTENALEPFVAVYGELFEQRHQRRIFAGASNFGARLMARGRHAVAKSQFIEKHFRWRLKKP